MNQQIGKTIECHHKGYCVEWGRDLYWNIFDFNSNTENVKSKSYEFISEHLVEPIGYRKFGNKTYPLYHCDKCFKFGIRNWHSSFTTEENAWIGMIEVLRYIWHSYHGNYDKSARIIYRELNYFEQTIIGQENKRILNIEDNQKIILDGSTWLLTLPPKVKKEQYIKKLLEETLLDPNKEVKIIAGLLK